jgi:hypothetical protein
MSVSSVLQRIGDKLAAIGFPYHFDESLEPGGNMNAEDQARAVMQLRDAVVFAEDTLVRALEPCDRAYLRSPQVLGSPPTASRLLQKVLVPYCSCLVDHPLVESLFLHGLLRKASSGATSETMAMTVSQHMVGVVLNAAVLCTTAFAEEGSPTAEDVNAAHEQYVSDQRRQHHQELVTTLDRLPLFTAQPVPAKDRPADVGNDVRLLETLQMFLKALRAPVPADLGEAVDASLRMLAAVQAAAQTTQPQDVAPLLASVALPDGVRIVDDPQLRDALRVMRMLFTDDLAALQNYGSAMVAQLQAFTATCKTDASLGVVGK